MSRDLKEVIKLAIPVSGKGAFQAKRIGYKGPTVVKCLEQTFPSFLISWSSQCLIFFSTVSLDQKKYLTVLFIKLFVTDNLISVFVKI